MSAARNLALEALRQLDRSLEFDDWENGDGEEIGAQLREAVAALLAETGEPVAWIDPRDLAVLTCPDVEEFGARRFAGVSGRPSGKNTLPLYTSQPPAVPPGWKLVPIEPTEEMLREVDEEVGGNCYSCTRWKASDDDCKRVYAAMISAAPGAPA